MLPSATLRVIDRLVTAVMTLVHAVAPSATAASTPTLPEAAAITLFFRLSHLVTRLISISAFGVRTPTKPKPANSPADDPAPAARPNPPTHPAAAASLPRRRGWLLAALPDIAPAVAADISALLADPAIATLLDLVPSLHRTLRPLLRSLGLDATPSLATPPRPPSSSTNPPHATPPNPAPPPPRNPPIHATASKVARSNTLPSHAQLVTIS